MIRQTALSITAVLAGMVSLASYAQAAGGTATVTLDGEDYALEILECTGNAKNFTLKAKAPDGGGPITLAAAKGEVQTLVFRHFDTLAQVADKTGTFDGETFEFEGDVQVFTTDKIDGKPLRVTATCKPS